MVGSVEVEEIAKLTDERCNDTYSHKWAMEAILKEPQK